MATCTITTIPPPPPPPVEKKYMLELSELEAQVLRSILGSVQIGGAGGPGCVSMGIHSALVKAGLSSAKYSIQSPIRFISR